jgi:manganese transport protein
MITNKQEDVSLSEVHASIDTTGNTKGRRRILAFLGPAYLVSVGYMDPGNWATDLAGGSRFGYSLLWVLLMSNLMALLLQSLSARLGIVQGKDLAQANREIYPKKLNLILYILAEIAIAATDLAEVLGMAIGIHLLTDLPLLWGVLITVLDTFILLYLQKLGIRRMEAFIIALVAIVGLAFLVEIMLVKPSLPEIADGLVPTLQNSDALYIAVGIIGATVMPHNLYLHSALVQTRKIGKDEKSIRRALKYNFIDSAIALNLAFFVNAAILILAATVFFKTGNTEVSELKEAHRLLTGFLGTSAASVLFAVALIAAGQSSTITGTLSGQIVMEGYLLLRINPWMRRLLTRLLAIIPAVAVILIYGDKKIDALLVLSQVILSVQLGFAIIPLIHFVSDRKKMGIFAIRPLVQITAWTIAIILIALNLNMVFGEAATFMKNSNNFFAKVVIAAGLLALTGLLLLVTFYPAYSRKTTLTPQKETPATVHRPVLELENLSAPVFRKIGIALDFSKHDEKLIAHALAQGKADCTYVLIHVVESATTSFLGKAADDFERRNDEDLMNRYIQQLQHQGFRISGKLGYNRRVEEIVRIVKQEEIDLLVMGAHGHSGVKDFLYGETINKVRHELKISVLVIGA